MVASIGATSTALVPVRSRAPSFLTLHANHDGSWGPSEIAAAADNFGSRDQSASLSTPGFLRRVDTEEDGRVSQAEFFTAGSLIAGTDQLLALQGEESAPRVPICNASAGRDYDAASALGARSVGTFIVAAA
jgi:hypothetical protein